jgi:rfaE bifunctional protein kinase chain/domain
VNEDQLESILSGLKNISILVIGDFFLDKYLQIDPGKSELSIETGLEAYQVVHKQSNPGAAGTVTNNLEALGVGSVLALGFLGDDGEGYDLLKSLNYSGVNTKYLIKTKERVTPTYTKPVIMENSSMREINRLDIKNRTATPGFLEKKIISHLYTLAREVDAVIALDQVTEDDCGVITEKVRKALSELTNNKKDLIVYSDSRAHTAMFNNVIIKCNHYEALKTAIACKQRESEEEMIIEAGRILSKNTGKPVFITYGEKGQLVFNGNIVEKVPAIPAKGPFDKCGAGDAATSGIVSALCCKSSITDAALLGNIVSSITIQQLGTTGKASPEQVIERFKEAFK